MRIPQDPSLSSSAHPQQQATSCSLKKHARQRCDLPRRPPTVGLEWPAAERGDEGMRARFAALMLCFVALVCAAREEFRMAIRITRVYTRTGDQGETALVGGKRVAKDTARIEAYGTLDELNSVLGIARAFNLDAKASPARDKVDAILRRLQNELFDLGSELATPPEAAHEHMFRVGEREVTALEHQLDELQQDLEPLSSFVLPGGGKVSAFLHQARTVCRRAERLVLRLGREEDIGPWPLRYLNRLSDLLFVLARWVAKQHGEPEFLWQRGLEGHRRRRPSAEKKGD